MDEYVVAYDILNEGIRSEDYKVLLVFPVLVVAFALWIKFRSTTAKAVVLTIGFAFFLVLGSCGFSNVLIQRRRCLAWARDGDYQQVEGEVRDFEPMPATGHANESFRVGDICFTYSDFDLSTGSFNNAASRGGPIRAGLHVRISHHNGRILKIEILKRSEPAPK